MKRSKKGFRRASTFIQQLTKESLEKRGFAQSKLITNWNEIVGSELFKISRPIKMSFPKNGLGATLTIEEGTTNSSGRPSPVTAPHRIWRLTIFHAGVSDKSGQ